MRRMAVLLSSSIAVFAAVASLGAAGASAAPMFTECPAVVEDSGCQFLVTVGPSGLSIATDPSQPSYFSGDDALVGVKNETAAPVSSIQLSAENPLFGFESDGICDPAGATHGPIPAGCVVLPYETKEAAEKKEARSNKGQACGFAGEVHEGKTLTETLITGCGFVPPAGEPIVAFPEGVEPVGFLANGDPVTGYEGPRTYFTNIGTAGGTFADGAGTVNFYPPLQPGESTYFGLEEPPTEGFGLATTLSPTASGGGQSGSSITVPQGTPVTFKVALGGANSGSATGTLAYKVYGNEGCTSLVANAGSFAISGGAAPASSPVNLNPGTYYWQAAYSGDANNHPVTTPCANGKIVVLAKTTTTTLLSGEGLSGALLPVLRGTAVTDKATIAGTAAAVATGTVTYTLFKDIHCTVAAGSSVAPVTAGVAGASAPLSVAPGTYYLIATYSGDGANLGSASACGSEVLVVSPHQSLGLAAASKCLTRAGARLSPHFPRGFKAVLFEEFINGALVRSGKLSRHAPHIPLAAQPAGTYKVSLLAYDAHGKSVEDTRTFHACVAKKHKKKHHK